MELVRVQRNEKQFKKAAGVGNDVLSVTEMLNYERKNYSELGKYVECMSHHFSTDSKKKVW